MPVAKSYQNYKIINEPYKKNGRNYVQVETNNGVKEVRWYSDAEYKKLYPGATIDHSKDPFYKSQREVLGFKNGYITIFKGNTYENKDWLKAHGCVYRKWWGWSLSSEDTIEEEYPEGISPVILPWSVVGKDNEVLQADDTVIAAVKLILADPNEPASTSEYVGDVGDKLTLELEIKKNIPLEGYYGLSFMHIMEDVNGNVFVWTTTAKNWPAGEKKKITGTVKGQKEYKGVKQTILTRCKEVA